MPFFEDLIIFFYCLAYLKAISVVSKWVSCFCSFILYEFWWKLWDYDAYSEELKLTIFWGISWYQYCGKFMKG